MKNLIAATFSEPIITAMIGQTLVNGQIQIVQKTPDGQDTNAPQNSTCEVIIAGHHIPIEIDDVIDDYPDIRKNDPIYWDQNALREVSEVIAQALCDWPDDIEEIYEYLFGDDMTYTTDITIEVRVSRLFTGSDVTLNAKMYQQLYDNQPCDELQRLVDITMREAEPSEFQHDYTIYAVDTDQELVDWNER